MDHSLIIPFTEKLTKNTVSGQIKWNKITSIGENRIRKNTNLYYAVFTNEFHQVRFENSYYTTFDDGYIYLIDETFYSGKDSSIDEGLTLYVQPNIQSGLTSVVSNTTELYRLSNAIAQNTQTPKPAIDFIQNFLNIEE